MKLSKLEIKIKKQKKIADEAYNKYCMIGKKANLQFLKYTKENNVYNKLIHELNM